MRPGSRASSRARRAAAALRGRSARTTAELTATRRAPASSTSSRFSSSIPPMANQGRFVVSAAWRTKAEAGEVGEVLGRAGEDRADAEVAGAVEDGLVELRAVVGRDADQGRRADDPPGVADGDVVLAEVDAVGAGEPGEVGAVVDDEPGPGLRRQDADLAGPAEPLAVGQALLAELDHVGPAGQGLADDPGQVAQRRQAADQDHQPGVAQAPGATRRRSASSFSRV